jgi:hypothetical protein
MEQAHTLEVGADIGWWRDSKGTLLALLMALIAGGFLPIFSVYSRPSTWAVWAVLLILIGLLSREVSLWKLFGPILPYFVWLLCFIAWGLIVSPAPQFQGALKTIVTTLVISLGMAILTSRLTYLKVFANALQCLVVGNLLLIPLMSYSRTVRSILLNPAISGEAAEPGFARFAGLWGNPNMIGYMCLVAIILSIWATPLLAWAGRLCSLPIIYLAASRKSLLLLLLIIALNILIVQRHNLKRCLVWIGLTLLLGSLFLVSENALRTTRTRVASDTNISRLLDFTESGTIQAGGETRMDLLRKWLEVASGEPWYGYGLGAMGGRYYSSGKVINPLLPNVGAHNTYVGVFIETGVLGFATFLAILAHYSLAYLRFRGATQVRWALLSLLACNLIILLVSHNHLFSFEGKTVYALFFLLPTAPALLRQARAF